MHLWNIVFITFSSLCVIVSLWVWEWQYTVLKVVYYFANECLKLLYLFQMQMWGNGVLMPLSTIFQLYRDSQFYWWKKPEYPEKTNYMPQVKYKQHKYDNLNTYTTFLQYLKDSSNMFYDMFDDTLRRSNLCLMTRFDGQICLTTRFDGQIYVWNRLYKSLINVLLKYPFPPFLLKSFKIQIT
jgi:hypothetical protein